MVKPVGGSGGSDFGRLENVSGFPPDILDDYRNVREQLNKLYYNIPTRTEDLIAIKNLQNFMNAFRKKVENSQDLSIELKKTILNEIETIQNKFPTLIQNAEECINASIEFSNINMQIKHGQKTDELFEKFQKAMEKCERVNDKFNNTFNNFTESFRKLDDLKNQ